MAESKPNPTDLPKEGATLEVRGYTLAVKFFPQIKLERKAGFDFAASLSDFIEPQGAVIEANEWLFSQPHGKSAAGGLQVAINQHAIQLDVAFPSHGLEWIEQRCEMVLGEFQKKFDPQMVLGATACVGGTLDVDGDARTFLAQHVMRLDVAHVNMLHRPIHLLGMRFFLPPFEAKPQTGRRRAKPITIDWQADVKAESLLEDPSKLFLEAQAEWSKAKPWKDAIISETVAHLATTKNYLEKDVVQFLQKPGAPPDSDDSEGPDEPEDSK